MFSLSLGSMLTHQGLLICVASTSHELSLHFDIVFDTENILFSCFYAMLTVASKDEVPEISDGGGDLWDGK